MPVAILGGLGAAAAWAVTILCASRATRIIGSASVLGWVMLTGFCIVVPWGLLEGIPDGLDAGSATWLLISGAGNLLTRVTAGTAVVFMLTSLALAYFASAKEGAWLDEFDKKASREQRERRKALEKLQTPESQPGSQPAGAGAPIEEPESQPAGGAATTTPEPAAPAPAATPPAAPTKAPAPTPAKPPAPASAPASKPPQ